MDQGGSSCEWCLTPCDCSNLPHHPNGIAFRVSRFLEEGGDDELKAIILKPIIGLDYLRAIINGHMPHMLNTYDKIMI